MTRILVVEDSPTQAEESRFVLHSAGYQVQTAKDGQAGLERLRAEPYDMVVSDVLMPGLDGYSLCRAIKSDPALKAIPVLLLTSLSDPLDVVQALECGADNFVSKPCEPELLLARVKSMLEHRELRAHSRPSDAVEILFLGRRFSIDSQREQILDLLVSTFEDVVRKHRELHASQESLRQANRELEAFSYSVAHDLGAPLRAIDGFSRSVIADAGDRLGVQAKQDLERVAAAAQRMRQIIDDLLRLSRVVKADLNLEDVNVSALARLTLSDLQVAEPGRELEISVQRGLRCHADTGLVRVLLENLLGNAWKFTRKRANAKLEFMAIELRGERVFVVRDNGAGFDMEHAHKLFLPFERLHSEDDFSGTGIGLVTARRVVERHGGRIWAEGAPGGGAAFYFTLPS